MSWNNRDECGCSLDAAVAKRRTPLNYGLRQHDAAPHGYRGVLASVRITQREREREREREKWFGCLNRLRSTQHAFAHKKAKSSGEDERSGERAFGGLSKLRYNITRPRAQQAKRSGEGAFLRLQHNTPTPRSENESDFKQSMKV
jgi:hypothetical protein